MITDAGMLFILDAMKKGRITLRLFMNNSDGTEFTEANGSGYSPIEITNWETTLKPSPCMKAAKQTFEFSKRLGRVYGYYFTVGNTTIAWDKFADPYNVVNPSDKLHIVPRIELSTKAKP